MYSPSYRTTKDGVPVLRKAEIDTIAERYIKDFCPQAMRTPMEIDIDSFALNYLGLKQDFQYLSHNGVYLGMTVFNDTDKVPVYVPETNTAEYISARARTVIIDNSLLEYGQEPRYRYTMGHESGHDILHCGYFMYKLKKQSRINSVSEPMIQCRAVSISGKTKPVSLWDDKDRMEWQANYMSSALLMPRVMVQKLIYSSKPRQDIFRDAEFVHEVIETFNVSFQAAVNRLKGLGLIQQDPPSESVINDFLY